MLPNNGRKEIARAAAAFGVAAILLAAGAVQAAAAKIPPVVVPTIEIHETFEEPEEVAT